MDSTERRLELEARIRATITTNAARTEGELQCMEQILKTLELLRYLSDRELSEVTLFLVRINGQD